MYLGFSVPLWTTFPVPGVDTDATASTVNTMKLHSIPFVVLVATCSNKVL